MTIDIAVVALIIAGVVAYSVMLGCLIYAVLRTAKESQR